MQIALEPDAKENYQKRKLSKKDVHALKLLSLKGRKKSSTQLCDEINQALPQGSKGPPLLHQQHGDTYVNKDYLVG